MDKEWSQLSSAERFAKRAKRKQERLKAKHKKHNTIFSTKPTRKMENTFDMGKTAEAMHENDEDSTFLAALHEHAVFLGMDPKEDKEFLWIAKESLTAALPPGWEQGETEDGTPYYYNETINKSIWEHPKDEEFRKLFQLEKSKSSASRKGNSSSHIKDEIKCDILVESDLELDLEGENDETASLNSAEPESIIKECPFVDEKQIDTKGTDTVSSTKEYFWESSQNPYQKESSRLESQISQPYQQTTEKINNLPETESNSELNEIKEDNAGLLVSKLRLEADLKTTKMDLRRIRIQDTMKLKTIQSLQEEVQSLKESLQRKSDQVIAITNTNKSLKASMENSFQSEKEKLHSLSEMEKEKLQTELNTAKSELRDMKIKLEEAERAKSELTDVRSKLEESEKLAKRYQEEAKVTKEETEVKVQLVRKELDLNSQQYKHNLHAVSQTQTQMDILMEKLQGMREKLDSERDCKRNEVNQLKDQLETLRNENTMLRKNEKLFQDTKDQAKLLESRKKELEERLREFRTLEKDNTDTMENKKEQEKKEKAFKDAYADRCRMLIEEKQNLIIKQDTERVDLKDRISSMEATSNRLRLQLELQKEESQNRMSSLESQLLSTKQLLKEEKNNSLSLEGKLELEISKLEKCKISTKQLSEECCNLRTKLTIFEAKLTDKTLKESKFPIKEEGIDKEIKLTEQIEALQRSSEEAKGKYANDIKEAMLETTRRVSEEWRNYVASQALQLQQQLSKAEFECAQLKNKFDRKESELLMELSSIQERFKAELVCAKKDSIMYQEMNRSLLQMLDNFSVQNQEIMARFVSKESSVMKSPSKNTGVSNTHNQVFVDMKIMKLNSQLEQLHQQFKMLENQENFTINGTPSKQSPEKSIRFDDSQIWEERDEDAPLSLSSLISGKVETSKRVSAQSIGTLSVVERSMLKRKQVLFNISSEAPGSQYQSDYWKRKYMTP